jgi:NAD+ synthase (glutamine-hydrolysing)
MTFVRVAGAQLNTVVGDLDGNAERIVSALGRASAAGADVCVFPELAITGYPPEDLLLKPGFVGDNVTALAKVAAASGDCVAVVGFVDPIEPGAALAQDRATRAEGSLVPGTGGGEGRSRLANAAAVCARGEVVGIYHKRLLPNYGVFDEERWFTPGDGPPALFSIAGATVGVSICEDVWFGDGPVPELGAAGADLVVNLNASPYSKGRRRERLAMLAVRAAEAGCPIVYVNQIGGQDELVFDGASLVVDPNGDLLAAGSQFSEDLILVDLPVAARPPTSALVPATPVRPRPASLTARPISPPLDRCAEIYSALVLGTRDYLAKNGFSDAIVGLSGGIDSALVAVVAADALGPAHVHALSMPSRYSSEGSLSDAALLAERVGIGFEVVAIEAAHEAMANLLAPLLAGPPAGLTDENLQSRLRGVLLMAISNSRGYLVLTTGNKSEMATGYSTLYGDSAGGFAVIKDIPKTLVYELCDYRNARATAESVPRPIPEAIMEKAPSAELRPDQRDDQSLPPYELLDPVLEAYVEADRTASELVEAGFDPVVVDRVVALVDGAEYKRRQMPPGVRITTKAFGKDRRMPITNHYRANPHTPELGDG